MPPAVSAVEVRPADAAADDVLFCAVTATDADDDAYRFTYRWRAGADPIPGAEAPALRAAALAGADVRCEATPHDGFDSGAAVTSAPRRIRPAPPQIDAVAVEFDSPAFCAEKRCAVTLAGDPAGVDVTYEWLVDGQPAGEGPILQDARLRPDARVRCRVVARNEEGASRPALSSAHTLADAPPTAVRAALPAIANRGEQVTCQAEGFADDCAPAPAWRYRWMLDGQPVPDETGATIDTAVLPGGLPLVCEASPHDGRQTGAPVRSNPIDIIGAGFGMSGDTPRGLAGTAVAVVDDLDGDGLAEVLVGAPNTTIEGRE